MSAALAAPWERLLGARRAGREIALLFDYDGTLVPIVEHPRLARLPPRTALLLKHLADQPRIHIGILSGRSLADLKQMVGLPNLYYGGASGIDLDLGGVRLRHPRADEGRVVIERLVSELARVMTLFPGAWVENKEFGLTVHYRAVRDDQIQGLLTSSAQILRPFAREIQTLSAPMALEVALALGWTKGTAVRMIVEHLGKPALPLYAGDAANDEDALRTASELGGVTVGVGPDAPANTELRVPTPVVLVDMLDCFREAL